jgi:AmmeMemoRadiSam system protein B
MGAALLAACPAVVEDARAHLREHAAEVQLPFLQVYLPEFTFVPVAVGTHELGVLETLGLGMAKVLRDLGRDFGEDASIVVSTDMNHYEDARTNRKKDDFALDALVHLDAARLHRACIEKGISMCGFAPSVAAVFAAVALGAKVADLVDYTHSGLVTGDDSEVVSYAAVRILRPEASP